LQQSTQNHPHYDPEVTLDSQTHWQEYVKLLRQLPSEQRDVLCLRFEAELSWQEIAVITDVTWETARSRARYGIKKLKQ